MKIAKLLLATGIALAVSSCGAEQKTEAAAEAVPAKLAAGLYEMNAEVIQLASTDQTTPATRLKQGDKLVTRACVAEDGIPAPELIAEEGDKCQVKNSYVRNGRMNVEMSCKRDGMSGEVMPAMQGSFSKDGFEGEITTLSYFIREGDYRLVREVTARRVGDCPAEGAAPAAS